MNRLSRILFKPVDNVSIVVFRMAFGLLILLECWGALVTGWVTQTFVKPEFTFTFIGFGWTHFLLGKTMYAYYGVMGCLGILIALGLFYRLATIGFTLLWGLSYFMQKSHYNNHYYLVFLVSLMLIALSANAACSLDVRRKPAIQKKFCASWEVWLLKVQIAMVYLFAAWAKLYPGWLQAKPVAIWLATKKHYFLIGDWLQKPYVHYFIAYSGIAFDLLFIPLLSFRKTRNLAVCLALIFHLSNSIIFQIGIFPYFALAFTLFYYPPAQVRRFFRLRAHPGLPATYPFSNRRLITASVSLYLLIQIFLPLRHYFIPGYELWTAEGHRMAWRMMLRTRSGSLRIKIRNPQTGMEKYVNYSRDLTPRQAYRLEASPVMMWQYAQHLKAESGNPNLEVYFYSKLSVNGSPYFPFIKAGVDLAHAPLSYFGHSDWILPAPKRIKAHY
ncbi:MAG: HTTM domain-containing protein [Flavobacteriales bacterium]